MDIINKNMPWKMYTMLYENKTLSLYIRVYVLHKQNACVFISLEVTEVYVGRKGDNKYCLWNRYYARMVQ